MISNSSPLIFLSKIGKLELLKELFEKISISMAVKEEVLVEGKEGFSIISDAIDREWILIKNPKKELVLELGKGENSVINLAVEMKEPLIIDDSLAIKIARSFNLKTLRTTSIVLLALKKKILTKKEAINCINRLIEEGYYISPRYYSMLIEKLNEH